MVLPLRLDVQVFSGIAPPRELLEAIAEAKASMRRTSTTTSDGVREKLQTEAHKASVSFVPPTPMETSGPTEFPARQGTAQPAELPVYSEAPPSYEDAIATNLPPVNAQRPDYAPPASGEDEVLARDEKKAFGKRRDS